MFLFRKLIKNNFYFYLFGISFTFISYLAIFNSLVIENNLSEIPIETEIKIDSKYSLSVLKQGISYQFLSIPINLFKYLFIFILTQYLTFNFFNFLVGIKIESKIIVSLIFLLGCYIGYLFFKLL
tara:strand:+ start:684 stop:1058 length:375 start_codon:yes stop_codon:yes gene_type:complete